MVTARLRHGGWLAAHVAEPCVASPEAIEQVEELALLARLQALVEVAGVLVVDGAKRFFEGALPCVREREEDFAIRRLGPLSAREPHVLELLRSPRQRGRGDDGPLGEVAHSRRPA